MNCNFCSTTKVTDFVNAEPANKTHVRNLKAQTAATAVFVTLALVFTALGALGMTGQLSNGAKVFTNNALWVTVAGAGALTLLALVAIACRYPCKSEKTDAQQEV